MKQVNALCMITLLVPVLTAAPAAAHDWYPSECCYEIDCFPMSTGAVVLTANGWLISRTGEIIPLEDERVRLSPDRRFHRCLMDFWAGSSGTRCLFVPLPDG